MLTNSIQLWANINRSQINSTDTHYNIKSIPITVDDSVMNDINYPADENAKGMPSMVGNPVTLGHPIVDGANVSGRAGKGLSDHFSGGTITTTYNNDGVWYADASIKKAVLNAQDGGTEYANLLDDEKPIGVSTGLMFEINEQSGVNAKGQSFSQVAINQSYDHLALLANEEPAGGADTVMRFNVADAMTTQEMAGNKTSSNPLTRLIAWAKNMGYNEKEQTINQNPGDLMDRKTIIGALEAKDISVNADISDDALKELLTNSINKPETKPVTNDDDKSSKDDLAAQITAAVNAAIKPLQDQMVESSDKEVNGLRLDMKSMTVNRLSDSLIEKMDAKEMNDHLAANGKVAFNSRGQQQSHNSSNDLDMKLPGLEA